MPVVEAFLTLSYSVSPPIRFLFLDLTCFIVENVLSHTFLTNFQTLSAVYNTVIIAHFLKKMLCLFK